MTLTCNLPTLNKELIIITNLTIVCSTNAQTLPLFALQMHKPYHCLLYKYTNLTVICSTNV